jgi:hypothetical protein
MPDGSTYVFVDGALSEIKEVEVEDAAQAELEALRKQLAEKEAELQANAETIAAQDAQITNIVKEVKELKAGITSRFDGSEKKENKKEGAIVNDAAAALANLKNKKRK